MRSSSPSSPVFNPFRIAILLIFILMLSGTCPCIADRIVTDISGTEVILPDTVNRISTVEPVGYQLLILLGEEGKLTGACTGWANRKLLEEINPVFNGLPWPGDPSGVNLEELLAEDPDLVISKEGYGEKSQSMRDVGLNVFEIYPENPDDLIESLSLLGIVLGKETEAEAFISYYNRIKKDISESISDLSDEDKKRVYIMGSSPLETAGSDYYQHFMVEAAGGENVASGLTGGWNTISLEEIYSWDPDIIIMMPYTSAGIDEITDDPSWQKITAVQNGQIYRLPKYVMAWDMPDPESILGIMWMASIFYPDTMQFDIPAEMKTFYPEFYRLEMTDEIIGTIITDQSKMKSSFDEDPTLKKD